MRYFPKSLGNRLVVGIALLAMVYVGNYYALVRRSMFVSGNELLVQPRYRIGGEATEAFFSFWHERDRQLRPRYWTALGMIFDGDGTAD